MYKVHSRVKRIRKLMHQHGEESTQVPYYNSSTLLSKNRRMNFESLLTQMATYNWRFRNFR